MKKRLRRTMMFLNAQRPGLLKDPYIYRPDSIIFDLEDAVAENQKDSARITLFNALKNIDYRGIELVVRINGLDTPHAAEDIRAAVAGGINTVRVPKTESPDDILAAETLIASAEKEFGREIGSTLMMGAIETPLGVLKAYEIATSSRRMMGISFGAGDYVRTMHTSRSKEGVELLAARSHIVIAARAAGIMCFDTVYLDVDNLDGFAAEVQLIKQLGFDGKSVISPRQVPLVHQIFTPSRKEIETAEKYIRAINDFAGAGVGVFTVDGQMVDIAMLEGAKRTLALAKASGAYEGDLL